MDLIFWRHAEAEDWTEGCDDMARSLTPRGEKQAKRMAGWLDRQLPEGTRVICSPARRCEQTVLALGRKYKVRNELAPEATADDVLEVAQWPSSKHPILVMSHQPVLGEVLAKLLNIEPASCPVRKGAVWWLRTRERERDGRNEIVVVAVQSPDAV